MLFYRVIRRLALWASRPMFRLRIEGQEQVPRTGAAILVAPHRSWLDPLCVGCASRRPVHFLIIDTVYSKPWARWFYRRMHSIPVARDAGMSLRALRAALRQLDQGKVVGIFPEGRVVREEGLGDVLPGAALLALRSGAPVIPVHIKGSADAWPHGRPLPRPAPVEVRVGAPLAPVEGRGKGAIADMSQRIEQALGS